MWRVEPRVEQSIHSFKFRLIFRKVSKHTEKKGGKLEASFDGKKKKQQKVYWASERRRKKSQYNILLITKPTEKCLGSEKKNTRKESCVRQKTWTNPIFPFSAPIIRLKFHQKTPGEAQWMRNTQKKKKGRWCCRGVRLMYKKEIMNETLRLNGRQPIARVSSKIRCRSAKKKLHRTRLFIVGTLNESLFCGVHARED